MAGTKSAFRRTLWASQARSGHFIATEKGTGPVLTKQDGRISLFGIMPRIGRVSPGGMVFHVLNRGVGRQRLFKTEADDSAFEDVVEETLDKLSMRICSDCVMPNHWHFVFWPKDDGDLAAFMQRLTVTHVTRWQKHRQRVGEGHVYHGRSNRFPFKRTNISIRLFATWNEMPYEPIGSSVRKTGSGPACGDENRASRKT